MAVFTIQNVPDTLKKQFKETCIKSGKSMAKVTIEMMIDYIAEFYQRETERNQNEVQASSTLNTLGFVEDEDTNGL